MKLNKDKVIADYIRIRNVWKVGKIHNRSGQSIYEFLIRNGIDTRNPNRWSNEQIQELTDIYNNDFLKGDCFLDDFCEKHKKLKSNVCRKARQLGLTNINRSVNNDMKQDMSIRIANRIKEKGHPKGYLGHKHSDDSRLKLSLKCKNNWKDPKSTFNKEEFRQKKSDNQSRIMRDKIKNTPHKLYSRGISGYVTISDKTFYSKSSWEKNIAFYLQNLKEKGEIKDWHYEADVFVFSQIKRGVRSFCPDFKIIKNDDSFYYIEVKGYFDKKSILKIERMNAFFPQIKLEVIDKNKYDVISLEKEKIIGWVNI